MPESRDTPRTDSMTHQSDNPSRGDMGGSSGDARFRVLAILAFAFLTGPLLFAIVTFTLRQGRGTWDAGLLTWAWVALTPIALIAARVIWGRSVVPHLPELGESARAAHTDGEELTARLVIVWALIEGPSLFGVVVYFIEGAFIPLAGVILLWIGMLLTRPRRSWFGR